MPATSLQSYEKKHFIAGAKDDNDQLCKHIFELAGRDLGRHVRALTPRMDKVLYVRFSEHIVKRLWDFVKCAA